MVQANNQWNLMSRMVKFNVMMVGIMKLMNVCCHYQSFGISTSLWGSFKSPIEKLQSYNLQPFKSYEH